MTSIISRMLAALFSKSEARVLMLGLDGSGRTTMMYKLKLDECVNTIPTIGFNIETVEYRGVNLILWDVGGGCKIRPLWRHYFQNMEAIIFFFDGTDMGRFEEALKELSMLTAQPELKDCLILVWISKQDLPRAQANFGEMKARLSAQLEATPNVAKWTCLPCSAISGEGVDEGLNWLLESMRVSGARSNVDEQGGGAEDNSAAASETSEVNSESDNLEATLLEWLEREDDDDTAFVQSLEDYTLDTWDHRNHLRIVWLLLEQHGRRKGMTKIFDCIRNFIANSKCTQRSRGTTFHETMTYFWVHMVDYARADTSYPTGVPSFKTFLLLNPELVNGDLFLHYYSKKLMLNTATSRIQAVLPDIRPLPSLLSSVDTGKDAKKTSRIEDHIAPGPLLTDNEWIEKFEAKSLPSWSGHDSRLRLIFLRLHRLERRKAVTQIFDDLKAMEGDAGHHITNTYFWITMVQLCLVQEAAEERGAGASAAAAAAEDELTFNKLMSRPFSQCLRNEALINKHYSLDVLDSEEARLAFAMPDLKPLPTMIK